MNEVKMVMSTQVMGQIKKEVLDLMDKYGYAFDGKGYSEFCTLYHFRKGNYEFTYRRGVVSRYRVKEIGHSGTRVLHAWDTIDSAEAFLQELHAVEAA